MEKIKTFLYALLRFGLWAVFIILIALAVILGLAQEFIGMAVAIVGAVAEGAVLRYAVYPKNKPRL